MLHDESTCGIVKDISRTTRLLGAENNGKVTCYLDSLLFALFARLDSFEVRRPHISQGALANLMEKGYAL